MGRTRNILSENIRSEKQMAELLGVGTDTLRKIAQREGFITAHLTERIRLYDITDAKRIFEKYMVVETAGRMKGRE